MLLYTCPEVGAQLCPAAHPMRWHSLLGRGGSPIPAACGCGAEGRGQWAWLGWADGWARTFWLAWAAVSEEELLLAAYT